MSSALPVNPPKYKASADSNKEDAVVKQLEPDDGEVKHREFDKAGIEVKQRDIETSENLSEDDKNDESGGWI